MATEGGTACYDAMRMRLIGNMGETGPKTREKTRVRPKPVVQEPPQFKVLLHNDHYTTMEFVVHVLENIFHKRAAEAVRIMLDVHRNGIGIAGVFSAEVAETKIDRVHTLARKEGFPLMCSMEPE